MVRLIALKGRVTSNKVTIELSLKSLRTVVADYNRFAVGLNREDPQERWPLYRVKNAKAFMEYILHCVMTGHHTEGPKLAKFVTFALEDILANAARRNEGLAVVPWTAVKDADGMQPKRSKKRRPSAR